MSGMHTQRFHVVMATDGDVEEREIGEVLAALGYHGLLVLDQARLIPTNTRARRSGASKNCAAKDTSSQTGFTAACAGAPAETGLAEDYVVAGVSTKS